MASINKTVRVGGSGYTTLEIGTQPIAYCQMITHTPPQPIGAPVGIQPLDAARPVEIIAPIAIGLGQISLRVYDLFNKRIWSTVLAGVPGYTADVANHMHDLADVLGWLASTDSAEINVNQVIRRPGDRSSASAGTILRSTTYHNCVITNISDGETIEVGTLEVLKEVTLTYRKALSNDAGILPNFISDSSLSHD